MLRVSLLATLVASAAGVSFLGCDSGKGAASPSNDPCHPSPPVRCDTDTQCYPFRCRSSFCDRKCTSSATCARALACSADGMCVKPPMCGTCTGDYDCPSGKKCDLTTSSCY